MKQVTGRIHRSVAVLAILVWMVSAAWAGPGAEFWALKFQVRDLEEAVTFYTRVLGFEDDGTSIGPARVLHQGTARILLEERSGFRRSAEQGRVYLNFRVSDLEAAAGRVRAAGGQVVGDPQSNQIGRHQRISDPSGNLLNLMRIEGDSIAADSPPVIFNTSLLVPDMGQARAIFEGIGFEIFSEEYLPETLPFKRAGDISVVLHPATDAEPEPRNDPALMISCADSAALIRQLKDQGVKVESGKKETTARLPSGLLLVLAARP